MVPRDAAAEVRVLVVHLDQERLGWRRRQGCGSGRVIFNDHPDCDGEERGLGIPDKIFEVI